MSNKLTIIPCPFCGSDNVEFEYDIRGMECGVCGATGPDMNRSEEDAIMRWNGRVGYLCVDFGTGDTTANFEIKGELNT